ncbi:hypothetical protein CRYUN_Cryun30bG0093600 [Craigia yunnanensis]
MIFKAADRNNIGGSAYGGQRSICCTPDLAKLEGCKQGEVIRMPSTADINWPIVLNIQFGGDYLSTSMDNAGVPITKTGMYNLFFIACDPKTQGNSDEWEDSVEESRWLFTWENGSIDDVLCVHGNCLFVA